MMHGDTMEVTTVEYGHETHSKLRVLDIGGDLEASGHPYELVKKNPRWIIPLSRD